TQQRRSRRTREDRSLKNDDGGQDDGLAPIALSEQATGRTLGHLREGLGVEVPLDERLLECASYRAREVHQELRVTRTLEPSARRDGDGLGDGGARLIDTGRDQEHAVRGQHPTFFQGTFVEVARTAVDVVKARGDLAGATDSLLHHFDLIAVFTDQNVLRT